MDRCFQKLKGEGKTEASAARICQSSTGTSLQTGKPPKKGLARCSKFLSARKRCSCGCNGCQESPP